MYWKLVKPHAVHDFYNCRWILASLLMASLCSVRLQVTTSMRWVDHIDEDDMNIFFDRAVIIFIERPDEKGYLKTHRGLALGVFITGQLILTSFNPFRHYIKMSDMRFKVVISVLFERQISDWETVAYTLKNYSIECARQVIPLPPELNIWHDDEQEQGPLHDLMVIRLKNRMKFEPRSPKLYSFDKYQRKGVSKLTAGPMRMLLAKPHQELGRDIQFASLGFIDNRHIFRSCLMRSHTFAAEDNVQTDCDGWLPRQWGAFICIRNIMQFKALGSGALLVHDHRLFGIGSFKLKKGNSSIFVFTDVREYYHLLRETCTVDDQKLSMSNTTYHFAYQSKEDYKG